MKAVPEKQLNSQNTSTCEYPRENVIGLTLKKDFSELQRHMLMPCTTTTHRRQLVVVGGSSVKKLLIHNYWLFLRVWAYTPWYELEQISGRPILNILVVGCVPHLQVLAIKLRKTFSQKFCDAGLNYNMKTGNNRLCPPTSTSKMASSFVPYNRNVNLCFYGELWSVRGWTQLLPGEVELS